MGQNKRKKRKFGPGVGYTVFILIVFALIIGAYFSGSFIFPTVYNTASATDPVPQPTDGPQKFVATHLEPPVPLKGLYMTACVAGTPSWREKIKNMINNSELNAVVIDIKDYTGTVSFYDAEIQPDDAPGCKVEGIEYFIQELHEDGIYVIGRISVFQDPYYTKRHPELAVKKKSDGGVWKDNKGLSFIDVGAKPFWDYIVAISKKSYELGFDELNYDYIRYPSDGPVSDIRLTWFDVEPSNSQLATTTATTTEPVTKARILEEFFAYLSNQMKGVGPRLSADLFGMTTTVTNDMGIGQILENTLPYFDYIDPMVYPSHYPATWNGFANPAAHPYEVVNIAMQGALAREEAWNIQNGISTSTPSKIRPWLQDFDLGVTYTAEMVRDQIRATNDNGIPSWLVWDASNKYTPNAYLTE